VRQGERDRIPGDADQSAGDACSTLSAMNWRMMSSLVAPPRAAHHSPAAGSGAHQHHIHDEMPPMMTGSRSP